MKKPLFLDLFAGAGGLSEGFIQAGFIPVAHVETDKAACFTLKTRAAYHWLKSRGDTSKYKEYLEGNISRSELYGFIPDAYINSVINKEISSDSIHTIFSQIDHCLNGASADLIIGGPPCQAYSLVGRARDSKGMKGDKRNFLYVYYAGFLKRYKPAYFVFENVTGLLSAKDEEGRLYFDNMRAMFLEAGYETEFMILSADEFGVLQNRKRLILVGCRIKKSGFFPEPEKWNPGVRVSEVFNDLPSLKSGEGYFGPCALKPYCGHYLHDSGIRNGETVATQHISRPHTEQDLEIYRIAVEKWNTEKKRLDYNDLPERLKTHANRSSFLDRFKVVAAEQPYSHTVVAHIAKDGHYYIHPDINQNRSITPREAARLQTFPDDYYFETSKGMPGRTPAFRQIGNAVPVLLARKIAEKLKEVWL